MGKHRKILNTEWGQIDLPEIVSGLIGSKNKTTKGHILPFAGMSLFTLRVWLPHFLPTHILL